MLKLFKEARIGKLNIFLLILFITLQMLGTLYLPTLTANIINEGVMMADMDYVVTTGAIMLGVATLTGIFSILATYYSAEVATKFSKNVRKKLFAHTQEMSYQDFKRFSASSLITRATNDIDQLQQTLSMFFEMMLPAPFVLVIGTVLAFNRDRYMALIVLISSFVLLVIFLFILKKIFPLFEKVQQRLDKITANVSQYLSGIRVVRAFNRTKLEQDKMDETFLDFARVNIQINRIFAVMMPLVMFIMSLATVAILWFGGLRIENGHVGIGDIMAVIEYVMNILMYLIMAIFAAIFIPRAKVCANRINEILQHQPEIQDGTTEIDGEIDSLTFENVSFAYQDAQQPVLQNLNFTLKKGTTTAIIGETGSGKSTVARLLPRLLDVTSGKVLLNGTDIKELPQEQLIEKVGLVPQKAFLFQGTIADNLKHGHAQATETEMRDALAIAQADSFINSLPEGLDAPVVQGGKNFSGGQRQRLSIARMLMKKAPVYVFDDSFSALDFKTDASLRKALKPLTKQSIILTIAQRVSSIKEADQIIVLKEGQIAGIGTHQELLHNCQLYLEIAQSQYSEEELQNELRK